MGLYSTAWAVLGDGTYGQTGVVFIDSDNQPKVDTNNLWYDELNKKLHINHAATAPGALNSSTRKFNVHGAGFFWTYNSEVGGADTSLLPAVFFAAPRGDANGLAANVSGDYVGDLRFLGTFGTSAAFSRIARMYVNVSGASAGNEGGQLIFEVKQDGTANFDSIEFRGGFFSPLTDGAIGLGRPGQRFDRLYIESQSAGAAGNVTLNVASGRVIFAAGAQTLTLTNSFIGPNTNVMCTVMTDDSTAKSCIATPASGSAVMKLNAAATGQTTVMFFVVSSDV